MLAARPATTGLQTALARLDQRIAAAVERANDTYGPEAARDSFRGLYLSSAEFERLLAQTPGVPILWNDCETIDDAAALAREFGPPMDSTWTSC